MRRTATAASSRATTSSSPPTSRSIFFAAAAVALSLPLLSPFVVVDAMYASYEKPRSYAEGER